jgi:hypothetical protein
MEMEKDFPVLRITTDGAKDGTLYYPDDLGKYKTPLGRLSLSEISRWAKDNTLTIKIDI